MCSSVCFLTCDVAFPLPPLRCSLEAAQRRVISHRERRVQELAVHQDHQLHRRGESPPAQRAGPLAGNRTRGGAADVSFYIASQKYCIHLNSACHTKLNGFVDPLRSCQRRKKCWSGRGSMRTADRKWWR